MLKLSDAREAFDRVTAQMTKTAEDTRAAVLGAVLLGLAAIGVALMALLAARRPRLAA